MPIFQHTFDWMNYQFLHFIDIINIFSHHIFQYLYLFCTLTALYAHLDVHITMQLCLYNLKILLNGEL